MKHILKIKNKLRRPPAACMMNARNGDPGSVSGRRSSSAKLGLKGEMNLLRKAVPVGSPQAPFGLRVKRDFTRYRFVYFLMLPVLAYFVLFKYLPMLKMVIAFQDFNIFRGIAGSKFVGLDNFIKFFRLRDCWRLIRNTLLLSLYSILYAFPTPVLLALMINEIKRITVKRAVQTISYMPHFISLVVVCGILRNFSASGGIINQLILMVSPGWSSPNLLSVSAYYRTIHIASSVWQTMGWASIIYLATLSTIDPQLYDAATVDGATRFQKIRHVEIPALLATASILLIMRVGSLMSVGFEKVYLMQNSLNISSSEVISTYVYKMGLRGTAQYSYAAAVGLFNTVINLILLTACNGVTRKLNGNSLW